MIGTMRRFALESSRVGSTETSSAAFLQDLPTPIARHVKGSGTELD